MNNQPLKQRAFKYVRQVITDLYSQESCMYSELEDEVKTLLSVYNKKLIFSDEEIQNFIEKLQVDMVTKMASGASIIQNNTSEDSEESHDPDWVQRLSDEPSTYSNAYYEHLLQEELPSLVVQATSDVTHKILSLMPDPKRPGQWDRRGLVIGHVQSGKTANYINLVAKAADAGYKFIIVIAGIHNNLRAQTQRRVDEGFIGRTLDQSLKRKPVGVGTDTYGNKKENYPYPVSLTNVFADFNKKGAAQSSLQINNIKTPVVLVIKKNVSVLKELYHWLKDLNASSCGTIKDVPMLMIDDEADNASINTNKQDDETNPTLTNRRLREILSLFNKSCFVGYTATPFANIFINPESYGDKKLQEELFPKDFIYCLDAPTNYFGPERVFLNDETSKAILEPIDDAENYLPLKHKKEFELAELPPSLYQAIHEFLLIKAIRLVRQKGTRHCSMLVNVSRFVAIQRLVRTHISTYLRKASNTIKANYALPTEQAQNNALFKELKRLFDTRFDQGDISWPDVQAKLFEAVSVVKTYVVNSKSQDNMDFEQYKSTGLTAIAVGGLSLSRGLTIEGLCVSYMYRNTQMYDTLMQMGRWFGYRYGYDDLCRVFLTRDSIDYYVHIAQASEELREQIYEMARANLTPKEFGLYVRNHPDSLLITARNKMQSGQKLDLKCNFSGRLLESSKLLHDEAQTQSNRELMAMDWAFKRVEKTKKGLIYRDVKLSKVQDFLRGFKLPPQSTFLKQGVIDYLDAIEDEHPHADVLLISSQEIPETQPLVIAPQLRKSATLHLNHDYWQLSKDRVASRGDEQLGLSKSQIEVAIALAKEGNKEPSDFHYRQVRKKPLLMLHNLNLGDGDKEALQENVPAFGISFPSGNYTKSVSVMVNSIYMKQNEDEGSEDE